MTAEQKPRLTQAERRARSRNALLEEAAQQLALHGYANLSLQNVAEAAGYTRGALYHQFAGKEELALAVVAWVHETWEAEVGQVFNGNAADPAEVLLALARNHALYCRRDVAAVMMNLRVEFGQRGHPISRAIGEIVDRLGRKCIRLIHTGRADGSLPPGPPAERTAEALIGVLEAVGIEAAGHAPHDVELAERAIRGVLGLPPSNSNPDNITERGPT